MELSVARHLGQFAGKELIYIPNPGNAGDSLIAAATYQLLDHLGLTYRTPRFQRLKAKDRIVVYGGGGNLVGPHTFCARVCREVHASAERLIILPHTIKNVTPLLREFGSNVDIFCREEPSYDYVRTHARKANVFLADDMALGLNAQDIREPFSGLAGNLGLIIRYAKNKLLTDEGLPSWSNVVRATRRRTTRRRLHSYHNGDSLSCFRTDPEKSEFAIPPDNIDVSEVFKFGVNPKSIAFLSAFEVLQFLQRFKTIHTNRLHMAIGGALCGCQVKFYPNNYYKCRAVYLFSLAERYQNVEWMGEPDQGR